MNSRTYIRTCRLCTLSTTALQLGAMTATCTCGPHPVVSVDLSSISASSEGDHKTCSKKRVQDACRSHGCFHLRLSVPAYQASPLNSLQGDLSSNIESLFDAEMTEYAKLNPDGGLVEASYLVASFSRRGATYRGRTSESGAAEQPEPKQSWELRRCHAAENTGGDDTDECKIVNERLHLLEEWTDGLHRAAEIVVELLGIDPNTVLQNGACSCSDTACGDDKCCMDLMRVFRYDALTSNDSRESRPGSSAHSDWGSLTIVWQDTSGGLQTFCHECDKWSNVAASMDDPGDTLSKDTVNLFVHVGDFLSLATGGEYASPRHQVLCPIRKEGSSKDSRCSLVYFAYPPLGVSLEDVEAEISTGEKSSRAPKPPVHYDRYSLLHNQSALASENSSEADVYERIRKQPFEKVIKEKWGQVQRK